MQSRKLLTFSLILTAFLGLGACSFPGVYKIDIQQGNVVTQDMIDELRPGMSKAQVRYIMGNPLITDTFHSRRWDYLYSLRSGSGERSEKRMSLYFNDSDQLIAVSGDFRLKPGKTRDEAILGAGTAAKPAAVEEDQDEVELPVQGRLPSLQNGAAAPAQEQAGQAATEPTAATDAVPAAPTIQFSDNRAEQPGAAPPGSVEEQIQRELDAVQPAQEASPSKL